MYRTIAWIFSNLIVPVNAGMYRECALQAVDEICAAGRLPLFVGGTGMYISAVFEGLSTVPDIDPAIRQRLYERATQGRLPLCMRNCRLLTGVCCQIASA